jgi:hypothetical protein
VTVNNNTGPSGSCNWNEYNLNPLTSNNWRASLVPAAAVIPAPIAYIKVVAVKKLVVGPMTRPIGLPQGSTEWIRVTIPGNHLTRWGTGDYFEEIRVFKAGILLA